MSTPHLVQQVLFPQLTQAASRVQYPATRCRFFAIAVVPVHRKPITIRINFEFRHANPGNDLIQLILTEALRKNVIDFEFCQGGDWFIAVGTNTLVSSQKRHPLFDRRHEWIVYLLCLAKTLHVPESMTWRRTCPERLSL